MKFLLIAASPMGLLGTNEMSYAKKDNKSWMPTIIEIAAIITVPAGVATPVENAEIQWNNPNISIIMAIEMMQLISYQRDVVFDA